MRVAKEFVLAGATAAALIAALSGAALAEDPPAGIAEQEEARALVNSLGSPSYRERQRASARLAELGLAAREALEEGVASPDPEVRERSRRALARVMELDYQRRVEAFAADTDPANSHGLAGWERFRALAREDAMGRALFVEMHRAEPVLMDSIGAGASQATAALAVRSQQLQEALQGDKFGRRRDVPLGSVAAVIFIAGDADVEVGDQMVNYLSSFMFQSPFRNALEQGERAALLKKLLGSWIGRTLGTPHAFHALVLSLQHDIKEGLAPALQMVAQGGVPPHMMLYALLTVGKFGGREHLSTLTLLLEDTTVCTTAQVENQQVQIEIRDVALAVLVHLSGQDFKEYGLTRVEKNPQLLFNPGSLGFTDASAREQAIARWKTWLAAQPKP